MKWADFNCKNMNEKASEKCSLCRRKYKIRNARKRRKWEKNWTEKTSRAKNICKKRFAKMRNARNGFYIFKKKISWKMRYITVVYETLRIIEWSTLVSAFQYVVSSWLSHNPRHKRHRINNILVIILMIFPSGNYANYDYDNAVSLYKEIILSSFFFCKSSSSPSQRWERLQSFVRAIESRRATNDRVCRHVPATNYVVHVHRRYEREGDRWRQPRTLKPASTWHSVG